MQEEKITKLLYSVRKEIITKTTRLLSVLIYSNSNQSDPSPDPSAISTLICVNPAYLDNINMSIPIYQYIYCIFMYCTNSLGVTIYFFVKKKENEFWFLLQEQKCKYDLKYSYSSNNKRWLALPLYLINHLTI